MLEEGVVDVKALMRAYDTDGDGELCDQGAEMDLIRRKLGEQLTIH